jgi:hypothetical protein
VTTAAATTATTAVIPATIPTGATEAR